MYIKTVNDKTSYKNAIQYTNTVITSHSKTVTAHLSIQWKHTSSGL